MKLVEVPSFGVLANVSKKGRWLFELKEPAYRTFKGMGFADEMKGEEGDFVQWYLLQKGTKVVSVVEKVTSISDFRFPRRYQKAKKVILDGVGILHEMGIRDYKEASKKLLSEEAIGAFTDIFPYKMGGLVIERGAMHLMPRVKLWIESYKALDEEGRRIVREYLPRVCWLPLKGEGTK